MSSESAPPGGRPATTARGDERSRTTSRAIYGDGVGAARDGAREGDPASAGPAPKTKAEAYDHSLKTWWKEYADRKNDEEEHVSDSLLYDYTHLPRSAPAPTLTDDRVQRVEEPKR